MARATFQGLIRSFSGASKESGVTPGPVTQSVVISFNPTLGVTPVRIGSSATVGAFFTLPAGAVAISYTSLGGATGGASPTGDIGTAGSAAGFFNEVDVDTAGVITGANGPLAVPGGITTPSVVTARAGASAAAGGTASGIFTYVVYDDASESN